ncbi:MAG: small terminase subunit, partial [Candidatus Dechloromonas phosphoritropha]
LATRAAFDQLGQESADIGDVLDLAKAAKAAQESRSLNLRERQAVAKMARDKLLEEQKVKLDAMGVKSGVTEETKLAIRAALGIM